MDRKRKIIALIAILIAASFVTLSVITVNGNSHASNLPLKVFFFNVGHGDSMLIETPDGKNVLIDAGSFDNFTNTSAFLTEHGIRTIDAFVVTHPHPDHISFAADVLANFTVLKIYMTKLVDTVSPPIFANFLDAVNRSSAVVRTDMVPGEYLNISSSVTFRVMWIDNNATNINDGSIVVKMTYGKERVLFAADAEAYAESQMVKLGYDLSADVLKVPHHGVNTSCTQPFLDAVRPKAAVITAGFGYGIPPCPTQAVMARLSGVTSYLTMFRHEIDLTMTEDSYAFKIIDQGQVNAST
ncbi:MAG: MBL fold metallo-hydrolase [Methanomassiliicoccales archaeon]|jgi:beta-lactamase superfamily II metal-dependent hydrolase